MVIPALPEGYRIARVGEELPYDNRTKYLADGQWRDAFTRLLGTTITNTFASDTIIIPISWVNVPLHEDFGG